MQKTTLNTATALLLVMITGQSAQAALNAVDPGPYLQENGGFAAWYQDTHGRVLDLCLSKATSSRVPGAPDAPSYMCALLPEPGFDDTQPVNFPTNFPGEAFWFTGDASIVDTASGIDLAYGSALEAAFAAEEVVEGDQVSFARIRIRVDVPTAGTYIVTHPYGTEVFEVDAADVGGRAINMTRDIGIGAPQTYDGALAGDVGPFLRSVNGPYTEPNPDTGVVETFIGDPNLLEEVTGSPFDTNYIRIQGPEGVDLRTDVFAVTGKLSAVGLTTPAKVERATYSRKNGVSGVEAQQDVFLQAPPPPGTASFTDSSNVSVEMTEANTTGNWYGQSSSNPTTLPVTLNLSADNQLAIPNSTAATVTTPLVDLVQIHSATYNPANGQLTISASSSDETASPTLTVFSNGNDIGTLAGAGPIKTLTTNSTPIPPAQIRVESANGGSDLEEVIIQP
ncbi:hypothetical protein HNR62_001823 [Oceanisphaera litoralis]|uniref:hypothetical protein n=1 Tax=Oceanisphaera litoralis TaxID=225144 RepID=UPI00195B782A|nr:hypothetical protein [Oceanisphaera litoralis]MBM7455944.1 hypothetical protein [Oceanisphaera litoralis]